MSWYKNLLPKIEEADITLKEIKTSLSKIKNVKDFYVWGDYLQVKKGSHNHIKSLDLLVKTNFDVGDLLAINKEDDSPFFKSKEELLMEGYNEAAVRFSKEFLKYQSKLIEPWCISKDNQILHWGPANSSVEEWQDIKERAEESSCKKIGMSLSEIVKSDVSVKQNWYSNYERFIQTETNSKPMGWYSTDLTLDSILDRVERYE